MSPALRAHNQCLVGSSTIHIYSLHITPCTAWSPSRRTTAHFPSMKRDILRCPACTAGCPVLVGCAAPQTNGSPRKLRRRRQAWAGASAVPGRLWRPAAGAWARGPPAVEGRGAAARFCADILRPEPTRSSRCWSSLCHSPPSVPRMGYDLLLLKLEALISATPMTQSDEALSAEDIQEIASIVSSMNEDERRQLAEALGLALGELDGIIANWRASRVAFAG